MLTAVCVAGLVAATVVAIRHGGRTVSVRERNADEPVGRWPGAGRAARGLAVCSGSGLMAGVLVADLGSIGGFVVAAAFALAAARVGTDVAVIAF